jgi:putative ABC transport system permease protein
MTELRGALRALRAAPGVSACAALLLALGIGATTAIFSILNGLLLKPLPVRDPHSLLVLASAESGESIDVPYDVWRIGRSDRAFQRGFAWQRDRVDLSARGESDLAEAIWASGDMFAILGVTPQLGRLFGPDDDRQAGGADGPVVVISDRLWRSHYQASPHVIGRTLAIERVPFRIVGVAPRSFFGVSAGVSFDVIMPLETQQLLGRSFRQWVAIMMRLGPGQSLEMVNTDLTLAQPRIREAIMPPFPRVEDRENYLRERWVALRSPGGVSIFRATYVPALRVLLAAAIALVAIVCANLALLLLGRATARQFEFSVRRALGASRARLVGQLIAESALLSLAGTIGGFFFALWSGRLLVRQLTTWAYTASVDLAPDWRLFSVAAAAAIGTALLFGAAPAIRIARVQPAHVLHRSAAHVVDRFRTGDALVALQLALSMVLVVASGLFIKSFTLLTHRDLGFDRGRVGIAVVDLRRATAAPDVRLALFERLRAAVASVPGVDNAAVSLATPIGPAGVRLSMNLDVPDSGLKEARVLATPVSRGWFRTYGTRLMEGRDFDERDSPNAAATAIVNPAFARRYLGGGDPLGHTIVERTRSGARVPVAIVGVVEDAAFASVRSPADPVVYRPIAQSVDAQLIGHLANISVSFRAAAESPAPLTRAVAGAIGSVDPELSISVQRLSEQVSYFYLRERLLAMVAGFFGTLGLVLAAIGLYGVTSYGASRRRREIGVRMALGADARQVRWMMLGRAVASSVLGTAAGTVCSVWLSRLVATLLYGVQPDDAVAFGAAITILLTTAAIAAWLPAHRAARLDPAIVLREL